MTLFLMFVLLVNGVCCAMSQDVSLVVNTSKGDIRGQRVVAPNGKTVYTFLGVPFGQSTAGENRFRRPVPVKPWEGIREAKTMPNACPQRYYPGSTFIPAMKGFHLTVPMSEDCLYLNIWLPDKPTNASKSVMVWFYGGGYSRGSISFPMFNGQILSSEGDVIVVTANYRVASMGFLYLDDTELPGNAGLYDQLLAVQWVKENIAAFGGNSDSITVFGQSAGGTSVGFLLMAKPHNLFKRAILQSASVTAGWASIEQGEARKRTLEVARHAGCNQDPNNFEGLARCLRDVDPITLVESEPIIPEEEGNALRPVRDGLLVPLDPQLAVSNSTFGGREILLGTNENEGTVILLFQMPFTFSMLRDEASLEDKEYNRFLKKNLKKNDPAVLDAVVYEYTNFSAHNKIDDLVDANTVSLDAIINDAYFTCRVEEMAAQYTGGDVYLYRYVHRASVCRWPKWMKVYHGHEIEMVFGEPLNPAFNYTQDEKEFSRQIIRLWTNFAKTGKPTIDSEEIWPKYTTKNAEYLILEPGSHWKIGRDLRKKYCYFWDKYLPKLQRKFEKKPRSACLNR